MKVKSKHVIAIRPNIIDGIKIIKDDTVATLRIPDTDETIQLKSIPSWFDKLKYKICGFKYELLRNSVNMKNTNEVDIVIKDNSIILSSIK